MEEARDIAKQGQSSYIYEGMFAIEIYRYEGEDAMYVYVSYNDPEAGSGVVTVKKMSRLNCYEVQAVNSIKGP